MQRVIATDDGEVTEGDIARNGRWGRSASVTGPRFRDLSSHPAIFTTCVMCVAEREYLYEFFHIVSGLSPHESP
jgi:hypothetical protein